MNNTRYTAEQAAALIAKQQEFRYQIGQDCWMVKPGYGHQLYRCFVQARIVEETSKGVKVIYRVKLEGKPTEVEVEEVQLFDVATRCNDALCFLSSILHNQHNP